MIKIFDASDALEAKIIGRSYPQVIDSDSEALFEENQKRNHEERFIDSSKEEFSVKISKSVKLTDTLSSFMVSHSPIVSEKFVELLKQFTIPDYKLLPIKIYRLKELVLEKKYFIMHFLGNDISNIDLSKSTFEYYGAGPNADKSLYKFDSYEEYMQKLSQKGIPMAIIKRTVMKPALKNDLFFLDIFNASGTFVTQPLKEAIENQNITGFHFEEVGYIEE